ncbi:MAG: uroporphyrinogen-III synthase [Actinomycetota bacterium]
MTEPLVGKVILVTRPGDQAASLVERLRQLGATAISAPTIALQRTHALERLDEAIEQSAKDEFDWVVFTSATGVRAWQERAEAMSAGSPKASVAAIGDSTSAALRRVGIEPDLVPDPFTSEALGEAFPAGKGRVLLARADIATDELERALSAKGWEPVRVDAYRVLPAAALPEEARKAIESTDVDAVTFTSPSTVAGYVELAIAARRPPAVCIGPVTATAARRAGFVVAAVADPHTEDGLIDALVGVLGPGAG